MSMRRKEGEGEGGTFCGSAPPPRSSRRSSTLGCEARPVSQRAGTRVVASLEEAYCGGESAA